MSAEEFMKLAEINHGFEAVHAYRDDVDHLLGGKDGIFWYTILKEGNISESWIGTYSGGEWKDQYVKGRGKRKKIKDMPAGSTIERITKMAYLAQDEDWVKNRKPRLIEDSHPHYHYVYGFGDKAADVSEQYGITIGYSDLKDVPAGFHLRYLRTGADVDLPEM